MLSPPLLNPFFPDGQVLRTMAYLGSAHGPELLLRGGPVLFGPLFWALRGKHRQGVRRNLRRILGPRSRLFECRDEVRTFVAFARSMAEGFAALGPRAGEVEIQVEGQEHLACLSNGGCIFVTGHTSSFEVAGAALARTAGVEIVMAMHPESNQAARQISDGVRERAGLAVVHVGDDPFVALRLAGYLRRGAVVGLQIDRKLPGSKGLAVTLFGTPTELPLGPFALARATGAPIVPVFTRRVGFLRARVCARAPIWLRKKSTHAELQQAAEGVAAALEAWVRQAPTEWLDWGGA